MDKEELIIELLKESREVQKELTGIIIDHREATHLWQNDTSHRLNDIEEDLRAHKEGVVNNRALIKLIITTPVEYSQCSIVLIPTIAS